MCNRGLMTTAQAPMAEAELQQRLLVDLHQFAVPYRLWSIDPKHL
jgi:hypothetical protein